MLMRRAMRLRSVLRSRSRPPLLLLHGFPQTHILWRKIAPELFKNHTLVMPDLRGYGDSGKPSRTSMHMTSERAIAFGHDQPPSSAKLFLMSLAYGGRKIGFAMAQQKILLSHSLTQCRKGDSSCLPRCTMVSRLQKGPGPRM
jgi:pimeloyl-ACP methyl ester carboxylesterase